jgi:hypothetical protein
MCFDTELPEMLRRTHVELIGYRPLRDLQRKAQRSSS